MDLIDTLDIQGLKTMTAGLSCGLVLVIDNSNQIFYEDLEKMEIVSNDLVDIKILKGPYPQETLINLIKKMYENTNPEYLKIIIYKDKLRDEKQLEQYKNCIKYLKEI